MALNKMKIGKAPGPSDVSLEYIAASMEIAMHAMFDKCQRVLDGY